MALLEKMVDLFSLYDLQAMGAPWRLKLVIELLLPQALCWV
jgi:hypothetical protein